MAKFLAPVQLSQHPSFGGVQCFYEHPSAAIGLPMRFSVYWPPQSQHAAVPCVVFLAGLTCTEETFAVKAGAQRAAAAMGLALISPDTSPRGANVQGEADRWDLGLAAGFYLDATQAPWSAHWRMESYLLQELLPMLGEHLPIDTGRIGLMGHSMGGYGALTLAYRHPDQFLSLSALAPICAPTQCPWGQTALAAYLGQDPALWREHDVLQLMQKRHDAGLPPLFAQGILVDQGLADPFLATQLHPHLLEAACSQTGQGLTLRRHAGYDHGYYFVSTFIEDHLAHHAQRLLGTPTP